MGFLYFKNTEILRMQRAWPVDECNSAMYRVNIKLYWKLAV